MNRISSTTAVSRNVTSGFTKAVGWSNYNRPRRGYQPGRCPTVNLNLAFSLDRRNNPYSKSE